MREKTDEPMKSRVTLFDPILEDLQVVFTSGVEVGDGGSCVFDVALFIYKVWLRKKKQSCFPEPLRNPTTGLSLFAYGSKTLSSQRPAQKASFLCFL